MYHDESFADALAYLDGRHPDGGRGLSGTFGPDGKRAKQGQATRDGFRRYVRLDGHDGRPAAELTLAGDVEVGSHQVATTIDVVLFADDGYGARVLNWDRGGLTDELAEVLAIPAALLVERELGAGTCAEVELWDLKNGAIWQVARDPALGALSRLARYLDQVEARLPS
jgi:hypothetical protein